MNTVGFGAWISVPQPSLRSNSWIHRRPDTYTLDCFEPQAFHDPFSAYDRFRRAFHNGHHASADSFKAMNGVADERAHLVANQLNTGANRAEIFKIGNKEDRVFIARQLVERMDRLVVFPERSDGQPTQIRYFRFADVQRWTPIVDFIRSQLNV